MNRTAIRRGLVYCMLTALAAALHGMPVAAADETQEAGLFSADSLMINGPKCLSIADPVVAETASCKPDVHRDFMDALIHWRKIRRIYVGYDGSRYDLPALQWTQSSFIQPQTMVEDRYFYDPIAGKYTVERYLADVEKRYGGIVDTVAIDFSPGTSAAVRRDVIAAVRAVPSTFRGFAA